MEGVEVKGTGGEVQEEVWKRRGGGHGRGESKKETGRSHLVAKIAKLYCIMITLVTYIHLYPHYLKVP